MDRNATRTKLREDVQQRDAAVAKLVTVRQKLLAAQRHHKATARLRHELEELERSVESTNLSIREAVQVLNAAE